MRLPAQAPCQKNFFLLAAAVILNPFFELKPWKVKLAKERQKKRKVDPVLSRIFSYGSVKHGGVLAAVGDHQLTRNLSEEQIKAAGFDTYFVDHTTGVFPQFASGFPWSAATMQVTGDVIGDLTEDLAADGAIA